VTDGLIGDNPVAHISASRYFSVEYGNTEEYEVDPFTPAEISIIYMHCPYPQWKATFQFALNTGMRPSELSALRWRDKTRAGTGKRDLNEEAIEALSTMKQFTQLKSEFVFEDLRTGEPWPGSHAIRQKAWRIIVRDLKLRYRNRYQTRHTSTTMHVSSGTNLFWLCKHMGHKRLDMLFMNYGSCLVG